MKRTTYPATQETYASVHLYMVEDTDGNLVDVIEFCSDSCHRAWCAERNVPYEGWNGCHEFNAPVQCQCCGQWNNGNGEGWHSE